MEPERKILVNNYATAKELDRFKKLYVDPAVKLLETGQKNLNDPRYRWVRGEKEAAKKRIAEMEGKVINFTMLHTSVMKLIAQHEELVDLLSELYMKWFVKISDKGNQPKELMNIEAEMIQDIFEQLHDVLMPLELDLNPVDSD